MNEYKIIQTHEFLATKSKNILVYNVRERSHPWRRNSCDFFPQTETHGKHKIMQFRPTGNRVRIQACESREIGVSFICVYSSQWRNHIAPHRTGLRILIGGVKICFSVHEILREYSVRFCRKIYWKLCLQLYAVTICSRLG